MTNTHTPGPWSAPRGGQFVFAADDRIVAEVNIDAHHSSPLPRAANARLIAAAPDLLAASRAALAALEALRDAPQGGAEVMLRAAIAKAEGRE